MKKQPDQPDNFRRSLASAGVIAPILFVAVFTAEGLLRGDYSAMKNFISELSMGDRGWVQVVNFMVFGFLLSLFSLETLREFRRRKLSLTGPVLLFVISVSYFFSGPFVTDPDTIFTNQKSIHGIVHGVFGAVVFTLMPVICWVFLKQFRKQVDMKVLKNVTLVFAIAITLAVACFIYITKVPGSSSNVAEVRGFFQRLALVPFMAWVCYFAAFINRSRLQK